MYLLFFRKSLDVTAHEEAVERRPIRARDLRAAGETIRASSEVSFVTGASVFRHSTLDGRVIDSTGPFR